MVVPNPSAFPEIKKEIFIKNMTEGNVMAFDAKSDTQKIGMGVPGRTGVRNCPSSPQRGGFVPTTSGRIVAVDRKKNQVAWNFQAGEALVNHILPLKSNRLLVTTFEGRVACLKY